MGSLKGRIFDLLKGVALQEATVRAVDAPDPDLRVITLDVTDRGRYTPGCKLQVLLPDRSVRTYTPAGWGEHTRLVAHRHDPQTPAGRWLDGLAIGDAVRFAGPQRALQLPEGAITLLGDATSIATAAAYAYDRPGQVDARFLMPQTPRATLDAVGLADARVEEPLDALLEGVNGVVGVTGSGAFVKQARAVLRERGAQVKVKAYWIAGRTGLD
jgi:NADPH-dependent ferric siderophore reductase